jgi:hypothetical protein
MGRCKKYVLLVLLSVMTHWVHIACGSCTQALHSSSMEVGLLSSWYILLLFYLHSLKHIAKLGVNCTDG